MTASDETGWEFGTEQRTFSNTGLTGDGRETIVAWEIVRVSPASTSLASEETRYEKMTFPVRRSEATVFTIRARMRYRFAPTPGSFAGDGPSVLMAEVSSTLPGDRVSVHRP